MSTLFIPRVENRHVLWAALSMVAIGLIVPGGFGIKPPQWLHDRELQDIAFLEDFDPKATDTSALPMFGLETPQIENDRRAARATQQAPELAQPSSDQTSKKQTRVVIVASKFARHIPEKHFETTGNAQKQSFIDLLLPLILAANDELLQRRDAVQVAVQANDRDKLDQWAVLYRIESEELD